MASRRRGDGVGCHNAVAATPSTRRRRRADRRGIAAPFSASPHPFAGGKPGFYPEIKGKGGPGGHFLFNLWDPFNFTTKRTAEQKERGLKCEILNGRAAMVGIMGMLSASTVRSRRPAGFFFDFEPNRTASSDRDAPRRCRAPCRSCRASRVSRSTRAT